MAERGVASLLTRSYLNKPYQAPANIQHATRDRYIGTSRAIRVVLFALSEPSGNHRQIFAWSMANVSTYAYERDRRLKLAWACRVEKEPVMAA
jgi:hypothetical protein